jgi:rod shape determining protein RodA
MKSSVAKIGSIIRRFDWWLFGAAAVLITLGLLVQYSLGANQDDPTLSQFQKQLTFVIIGTAAFLVLSVIDHRLLTIHPFIHAGIALFLLVAVLLFGQTIQGTTGWFVFAGFSAQPVEFVKMLLLLFIASYIHADISLMRQWKPNIVIASVVAILVGLVFLQPDLGSALMLFFLWFAYILILRAPKKFIGLVVIGVIAAFILGWFFLFADYQRDRLTTFINPEADALGSGYNITQSIVAVGSGGMWGRGLGLGTQSQLHFLPEATSDFIFAVIAEELGFFGVLILFSALAILVWRLIVYARRAQDSYSFVMVLGVLCYMVFQSTLVIGMNIGLLPITGVPLPLVSAGGSSMIATLLMLGLAHRIGMAVHD